MVALITIVWLMSGCATTPDGPVVGELPTAQQAVSRLEQRREAVRSFVMQGSLSARTADSGNLSGDHVIYGAFPDRLRADVLGPFGQPVLRMITDGGNLSVLSFDENRVYLGRATRQNVARFLGVSLSPQEIFTLLSGSVPFPPLDMGLSIGPVEPGSAVLRVVDSSLRITEAVEFRVFDYSITSAKLRQQDGQFGFSCGFDDFQTNGPWRNPRKVSIESSDGRALALENSELLINQPVDGKVFEAPVPKGVEVRWLK